MAVIRILFLADTHLGFDYPFNPRIQRRRRGHDFFSNYMKALEPARKGEVDAVIHGGDLLFRSRVPARLVDMALAPLKEIADQDIEVFLVPGNHERSKIPFGILSLYPNLHIFNYPRTFILEKNGLNLALSGFPYCRDNVRVRFPEILQQTGWQEKLEKCDGHILCVHHCFEGATVGPSNYTFRYNDDVIRLRDIPDMFAAILTGHVHRFQVLTKNLSGGSISSPIFYPGSIERSSFAEIKEKKGYLLIDFESKNKHALTLKSWEFVELPARPMVKLSIPQKRMNKNELQDFLKDSIDKLDPQSIVKIQLEGEVSKECIPLFRAASLRALCPKDMNISVKFF
jgi:DNA repair exonuclease SbcCD nuclease subunit